MLVFVSYPCCLVAEEHKVIAVSDWSESVVSHDRSLRARVLVLEGRSRAYAGPDAEVLVYVEIENTCGSWHDPLKVYFDAKGLSFQVLDDKDKPIPPTPTGGSGGDVGTTWVTIPYDSSVRLRANPGGWGRGKSTDLVLPLRPMQGQYWRLPPDQDYSLSGSLKISPPTKDTFEHSDDWRGELKFPKTKIPAKKADSFPRLGMQAAIEAAEAICQAKQARFEQLLPRLRAVDCHAERDRPPCLANRLGQKPQIH